MRKVFLILAALVPLLCLNSCSDDESSSSYSVMVNVFIEGDLAYPSLVRLYNYDKAANFDKDAIVEMGDNQELVDENGNVITPAYSSGEYSGVNTFEGIEPGRYIIVVLYQPEGYSFPMFYYYGYKSITVDETNNANLYKIDFQYEDSGKFVEF